MNLSTLRAAIHLAFFTISVVTFAFTVASITDFARSYPELPLMPDGHVAGDDESWLGTTQNDVVALLVLLSIWLLLYALDFFAQIYFLLTELRGRASTCYLRKWKVGLALVLLITELIWIARLPFDLLTPSTEVFWLGKDLFILVLAFVAAMTAPEAQEFNNYKLRTHAARPRVSAEPYALTLSGFYFSIRTLISFTRTFPSLPPRADGASKRPWLGTERADAVVLLILLASWLLLAAIDLTVHGQLIADEVFRSQYSLRLRSWKTGLGTYLLVTEIIWLWRLPGNGLVPNFASYWVLKDIVMIVLAVTSVLSMPTDGVDFNTDDRQRTRDRRARDVILTTLPVRVTPPPISAPAPAYTATRAPTGEVVVIPVAMVANDADFVTVPLSPPPPAYDAVAATAPAATPRTEASS
ncbi:hypothetical protein H9P43_008075 [Blastocladiella emersonii ATCC 22665]|nr:hypothetical protein H9P43_008075 [Blastocladiella emersonii ATCC 22665]